MWTTYVGSLAVTSCLAILVNLAILAVVLSSGTLRSDSRHLLMVSLATLDLLMGSFFLPLRIKEITTKEPHPCHVQIILQVIDFYGSLMVAGWTMVTINWLVLSRRARESCGPAHYLMTSLPASVVTSVVTSRLFSALLVSWPWLMCVCVLVPTVASNVQRRLYYDENPFCFLDLGRKTREAFLLLNGLIPQGILVSTTVICLVLMCRSFFRGQGICCMDGVNRVPLEDASQNETETETEADDAASDASQAASSVSERTPKDSHASILLPNIVFMCCVVPAIACVVLRETGVPFVGEHMWMLIVVMYYGRSFLLGLSWFTMDSMRLGARDCWTKVMDTLGPIYRHDHTTTSTNVSFNRLRESNEIA